MCPHRRGAKTYHDVSLDAKIVVEWNLYMTVFQLFVNVIGIAGVLNFYLIEIIQKVYIIFPHVHLQWKLTFYNAGLSERDSYAQQPDLER